MTGFTYHIKAAEGLHALPAAAFVKQAGDFPGSAVLTCKGRSVDAKRVMHVMSLGIKQNDVIEVSLNGDGEDEAASKLKELCEKLF
ncbi:MAG: HPr family phosphocarrier protein [Lachnospiraceae bacterium]|nr:HPr family phosphocarrier protein [Lachnospiraceae bacterium]